MPTLHLPLGQPRRRLFESARSSARDTGPLGEDLATLAFTGSGEARSTWPELPPVCLVTGERSNVTFRDVKFSWFPRWVFLLALVPAGSVLLAGLVAAILTRRASGELPFSSRGWLRWRVARMTTPISVVLALGALFMGMSFMSAEQTLAATLALGAMVGVPLALYLGLQHNRMVLSGRITDTEIAIEIPREEAARAILDHLCPPGAVR